jgi:ABC-type transport system substrate-binding protein
MMKKTVFAILAIAMMTLMLVPANAFIFPNCTSDASFEQYGPRADRLLIHLYADDVSEFAALRAGEIDIADWPLSKAEYLTDSVPPYNYSLKIVNYGAEYGLYIIDFNNNNNTYLGNPPDPGNGNNPQVLNSTASGSCPHGNWLSDVWLRRAIDYLVDRVSLIADPSIGAGFGFPLYTVIPPPQGKYLLNVYGNMTMQWAWYFSPSLCNATLEAHGYIEGPSWTSSGLANHVAREYLGPGNYATLTAPKAAGATTATVSNGALFVPYIGQDVYICTGPAPGVNGEWHHLTGVAGNVLTFGEGDVLPHAVGDRVYAGQLVTLKFWIRSDHAGRLHIGTVLVGLMEACNIKVDAHYANSGTCHVNVMTNKDFHMYTGGWSLSAQPDFLILWDWNYYWHPGDCYNYDGCNDPDFNAYAEGIMYANSQAEAVSMALRAQMRMAWLNLACPVYCVSGNKAYARWNVNNVDNPADTTVGQQWWGVVNIMGYGIDNGWSFMDMHTNMTEWGGGMTIDYGFKVPELKQPNIVYASWLYDTNYLGQMYESLLASNASNLAQILPWIATNYTVGLYDNPNLGPCSRVTFTLDPNVVWNDGTPLTMADVYFSMWEIKTDLTARHFPNPWWWSNVQDILSFSILDPYTFEVLLDVKSYWALYWIGGSYILPKHIWKPIIATGDPTATCPDTNFVASGPWMSKYAWYVPSSHILLVKNPDFHHPGPISCTLKVNSNNFNKFMPADGLNPAHLFLDCRLDPSMPYHQYVDQINYTITLAFKNTTYAFGDPPHDNTMDWIVVQGQGKTIYAGGILDIPIPITFPGNYQSITAAVAPGANVVIPVTNAAPFLPYVGQLVYVGDGTLPGPGGAGVTNGELATLTAVNVAGNTITVNSLANAHAPPTARVYWLSGWKYGDWEIEWLVWWNCKWPPTAQKDTEPAPAGTGYWYKQYCQMEVYCTRPEDVCGSTYYDDIEWGSYPYKFELVSPDKLVDVSDVALIAGAFGGIPGNARWNAVCDLNHDYLVDVSDLGPVAAAFGFHS